MSDDVTRSIDETVRRLRADRPKLRAELRERRRQARDAMKRAKEEARARIANDPRLQAAMKRARNRRARNIAILVVIVLLILWLLSRCECEPPPPVVVDAGVEEVVALPPHIAAPKKSATKAKHNGNVAPKKRGDFAQPSVAPPPWLDALHLQVAARSRRLAACFAGASVPGALKWTVAVDAKSGAIADSQLEPVGTQIGLTSAQQGCLQQVLADPKYKLPVDDDEALTKRASLLIEF